MYIVLVHVQGGPKLARMKMFYECIISTIAEKASHKIININNSFFAIARNSSTSLLYIPIQWALNLCCSIQVYFTRSYLYMKINAPHRKIGGDNIPHVRAVR